MRVVVGVLIGLLLATTGLAGASLNGYHLSREQKQRAKMYQVRKIAKQVFVRERYDDYRLDLLDCQGDQDCITTIELGGYGYSEVWTGWPTPPWLR